MITPSSPPDSINLARTDGNLRPGAAAMAAPQEQRDDSWSADFLRAVPNASLASFDPQIQTGPDTFPYFQLALPDPGPFSPFSIVHILNDVLQKGAGVVIHTNMRRD